MLDQLGVDRSALERVFWRKVAKSTQGCWEWRGSRQSQGYGRIEVRGRALVAHRLAYALTVGPIPEGLVIDHRCRNKACVRPDHLEAVTPSENTLRHHYGT